MNLFPGRLERAEGGLRFVTDPLALCVPLAAGLTAVPETVIGGVRPEHLLLRPMDGGQARVVVVERAGHETLAWITAGERRMVARLPARTALQPGDAVTIDVDPATLHLFDQATGARLNGPCIQN